MRNTNKIGYSITGFGGQRGKFHLMHKNHFLCSTKFPKNNVVLTDAPIGIVECKKCLKKIDS